MDGIKKKKQQQQQQAGVTQRDKWTDGRTGGWAGRRTDGRLKGGNGGEPKANQFVVEN